MKKWLFFLSPASFVFLLENFIKNLLRENFPHQSFPVIDNIFRITVVFNQGGAFGILPGKRLLLILINIFFIIFFFIFICYEKDFLNIFICGFILGGALSNFYDRLIWGYVVDYLDFRIWPVFNLADTCITLGVFCLILRSFKNATPSTKKKPFIYNPFRTS